MNNTSVFNQDLADALNNAWEKWTEEIFSWLSQPWNDEPILQPVRLPETNHNFHVFCTSC